MQRPGRFASDASDASVGGDLSGLAHRGHVQRKLVLPIREAALGAEHPHSAASLNNLGFLPLAMGDYAGARPYYERALAITEARPGPGHSHTRVVRGNLAALLDLLGEPGARDL